MMEESKYSELEARLQRAHRKSWLRFFIFMAFVLALWIATYVITQGKFTFAVKEKKDAVYNTVVVNQDDALAARDSIIKDQKHLIDLLTSQVAAATKPAEGHSTIVEKRIDTIRIINQRVINHDIEIKHRDSLLRNIRQQYDIPNAPSQINRKK